jgi:hypothetical protein
MSNITKPLSRPITSSMSAQDLSEAIRLVEVAKARGWISYRLPDDQPAPDSELRHYRKKLAKWRKRTEGEVVVGQVGTIP